MNKQLSSNELATQRWAITGAAGRIGTLLRKHLVEQVGSLLLLDRTPITDLHDNESAVEVDLLDFALLSGGLTERPLDGIVHLGGVPDEADFHDLVDANITGTYHVLEAARQADIKKVVYASSNRVTGFYPVTNTVDVGMPFRPDSFYGVSKAAGETLCRMYADKFDMRIACPRIGRYEAQPGTRRELSTWVSPRDLVAAFTAAMVSDDYRFLTYYAVSNNTHLWWDLDPGRTIAYYPTDNAQLFADGVGAPLTSGPQGGEFTTAAYSLHHVRPYRD